MRELTKTMRAHDAHTLLYHFNIIRFKFRMAYVLKLQDLISQEIGFLTGNIPIELFLLAQY